MGPSSRLEVGEAAGEQEEGAGIPFVGASGHMLDAFLRKAGVSREQVSIANTLSCRPPNNAYPTDQAARTYCTEAEGKAIVSHCYERHLKPVLESREWERIDAIGNHSLEVLTGKTGIMRWRGSPLPLFTGSEKPVVMPVLHPSYLMRDQSMIPATVSDLSKGMQVPPQHYELNPTIEQLEQFDPTTLCADIETNRYTSQITMVGIANRPHHVLVVPFRGSYIGQLKRIFAEAKEVIGQNIIQFDLGILAENGIKVNRDAQIWDIMLIHHLLHPDEAHDLEYIASIYTQMLKWKYRKHESEEWYNACDVDATLQSFKAMLPVLRQQQLENLYRFVQVPLGKLCRLMQQTGIKVDPNRIRIKRVEFEKELADLEATLPQELQPFDKAIKIRVPAPKGTLGKSGKPIKYLHEPSTERVVPWDSPKQVERYLYETLALPKQLHAKTKKLTSDKTALEKLYRLTKRPEIDALRKVRQLGELIGTFLKDGDEDKQVAVGRIHSNFLVHGTSTGRLSSSGPNLQNIPSKARYIYVPSYPDWCFIEADFSSLENRLSMWYANDTERMDRLAIPGFDEHTWFTAQVYGIPESEVTKDQRRMGKIANHGCDGGLGPRKLATTHSILEKEARLLIAKWREVNVKSAKWQEEVGNEAAHKGVLTTAFGRKRWFWSHSAYTEGIRFKPQSSGADILYRAMLGLFYARIEWDLDSVVKVCPIVAPIPQPARLVLVVHDSILIESPIALVPEIVSCLHTVMQQPWTELAGFSIPAEVKVGAPGASWAELEKYELR